MFVIIICLDPWNSIRSYVVDKTIRTAMPTKQYFLKDVISACCDRCVGNETKTKDQHNTEQCSSVIQVGKHFR